MCIRDRRQRGWRRGRRGIPDRWSGAGVHLDPVSYTHLDVYKRQPVHRPAGPAAGSAGHGAAGAREAKRHAAAQHASSLRSTRTTQRGPRHARARPLVSRKKSGNSTGSQKRAPGRGVWGCAITCGTASTGARLGFGARHGRSPAVPRRAGAGWKLPTVDRWPGQRSAVRRFGGGPSSAGRVRPADSIRSRSSTVTMRTSAARRPIAKRDVYKSKGRNRDSRRSRHTWRSDSPRTRWRPPPQPGR